MLRVAVAGDYNLNGVVDAADYVVWRKTDGTQAGYKAVAHQLRPGRSSPAAARSNGYSTMPAEPVSLAVPEPTALVLLMFAAAGWCLRRRRAA